jgi:hypothetical protein
LVLTEKHGLREGWRFELEVANSRAINFNDLINKQADMKLVQTLINVILKDCFKESSLK